MHTKSTPIIRISTPCVRDQALPAGVNDCCHSWVGGVEANSKHVIRNPRLMLILWGNYYETSSDAIAYATQMITDLVTGTYVNNLCQYGVAAGSISGTAVIDTNNLSPAPATIDSDGIKTQLKQWMKDGMIQSPTTNEQNVAYFILPPPTTQLTLSGGLKGDIDFCGYHNWDTYNPHSTDADLFFGIVSTQAAKTNNPAAKDFIHALSGCVSHELAEMFTNRDGSGYVSKACKNSDGSQQTCEIGDICETKTQFQYQRAGSAQVWSVEQYWSGWDNSCINGNTPVSVKRFLAAIGFDYHNSGLRSLGTSDINLRYIASRM